MSWRLWFSRQLGKMKKLTESDYKKIYKDLERLSPCIDNTEYSRSDRARCRFCKKLIGKGTIRGNNFVKLRYKTYRIKQIFCTDCTIKLLEYDILNIRKLLHKVKGIKKGRKKIYEEERLLREKDNIVKNFLDK